MWQQIVNWHHYRSTVKIEYRALPNPLSSVDTTKVQVCSCCTNNLHALFGDSALYLNHMLYHMYLLFIYLQLPQCNNAHTTHVTMHYTMHYTKCTNKADFEIDSQVNELLISIH